MALARAWSVALHGVDGQVVEIEADIGGGLPGVHLLGLPDAALQESRDRVRAAVVNSGRTWPNERIVLALSPATMRKTGSGFDLASVKYPVRSRPWVAAPPSTAASARTARAPDSAWTGRNPIAGSWPIVSAGRS
jgi:magnesium chelatase family protein